MHNLQQGFNYNDLSQEDRVVVQKRTHEIKNILRRTAQDIVSIGQKLTDVKKQLGHGNFRNWLHVEFELSLSAATKFMQVYEQFKDVNFTNMNVAVSALYLLAAPSTPGEARQKALARACEGEPMTYSKAKTIVGYYKKATANKVFMAGLASPTQTGTKLSRPATAEMNDLSAATEWHSGGCPGSKAVLPQVADAELRPSGFEAQPKESLHIHIPVEKTNELSQELANVEMSFRVWIDEVGSIIKLYKADELECSDKLIVGTTVKILVGRFAGQAATIKEILFESKLARCDASTTEYCSNICVIRCGQEQASTEPEIPRFEVNYASIQVAFTGNPENLISFFEQMRSDPIFAEEVFRQIRWLTEEEL